jgi:protein-tyrosine phosphatase
MGGLGIRKEWRKTVRPSPGIAGLFPLFVTRLSEDSVEVRWNDSAGDVGLSIYRGDSPDCIQTAAPLAETAGGGSVLLSGLPLDRPHFFKLVAADGAAVVGERRPVVEGAPNLRDLGGYETAAGRRVKWGRIFRSSNLGRLTDRGLEQIRRLGIKFVCDFRTAAEAAKMPNRFPDSEAVGYLHLPIQHGDFEPTSVFDRIKKGDYGWISEDFMIRGYIESVERYPAVWERLFELLAEPNRRPLLFHCTGGKDRTGVAAALILLALGVPRDTVVADYGLSDGYNSEVRRTIYAHLKPFSVDTARVAPYFTAPESRLRAFLKHIDTHYGSAVGYLVKRAGVGEETIARLKSELLEE